MGHSVPWSDLPPELVSAIAKCLTSTLDIFRFRSVCKSWCSSVSRPSNLLSTVLPLKVPPLPHKTTYYPETTVIYSTSIYLLQAPIDERSGDFFSSLGLPKVWLLFVDEVNPGKLYIRMPLSKSLACPLPYSFPESLSLLDFHCIEVGKYCTLKRFIYQGAESPSFPLPKPQGAFSDVDKSVSFSDGSGVLVLHDGQLILLKLGENGCENWVVMHDGTGFKIDDIVDYKGRICAVNRRGKLYGIKYGSPQLNDVIGCSISRSGGRRKRLIASSVGLYMVVRCPVSDSECDSKAKFKVYLLKENNKKWIEISSLDGQVFFLGLDYSFSVSAEAFAQSCQGNCIIFMKYSFPNYVDFNDDDYLFGKSGQKDIYGVFHLEEGGRFGFIESYPIYSHMLWPPPFWLWANTKTMVNVAVRSAVERFRARDIFNKAILLDEELKTEVEGFNDFIEQVISCCQEATKENKDLRESGSLILDAKKEVAKVTLKEPLIRPEVGKTAPGIKYGPHCRYSACSSVKDIDWRECFSQIKEVLKACKEGLNSVG